MVSCWQRARLIKWEAGYMMLVQERARVRAARRTSRRESTRQKAPGLPNKGQGRQRAFMVRGREYNRLGGKNETGGIRV